MQSLKFLVPLLVVVLVFTTCEAGPTGCEAKGKDIRCAKDNAGFDRVRVVSRSGSRITFRVGFWISSCGWPGSEYGNEGLEARGGVDAHFDMAHTDSGKCREAFIYDCKLDGVAPANCNDALNAFRE